MGVEYVDDTIGRAKGNTELFMARASRLVVLSAGAFGSPSILERSGIGLKDILTRNNVQQLVDLPGVGEHYMGSYNDANDNDNHLTGNLLDHNLIALPFVGSEDAETMDELLRGTEEEIQGMQTAALTMHYKLSDLVFLAHTKKWLDDGKGLIASKLVSVDFNFLVVSVHIS